MKPGDKLIFWRLNTHTSLQNITVLNMDSYIFAHPSILPEYVLEPSRQEAIHARHRDFQGRIREKSVQIISISECRWVQGNARTRRDRRPTPY